MFALVCTFLVGLSKCESMSTVEPSFSANAEAKYVMSSISDTCPLPPETPSHHVHVHKHPFYDACSHGTHCTVAVMSEPFHASRPKPFEHRAIAHSLWVCLCVNPCPHLHQCSQRLLKLTLSCHLLYLRYLPPRYPIHHVHSRAHPFYDGCSRGKPIAQWMSCQKHFTPHVRTISRSFHDPHRAQRITTTPPETRVRGEGGGGQWHLRLLTARGGHWHRPRSRRHHTARARPVHTCHIRGYSAASCHVDADNHAIADHTCHLPCQVMCIGRG